MYKSIGHLLKVTPALLGLSFFANSAVAQNLPENTTNASEILQQIDQYNQQGVEANQGQVRSISELRDVSPGDWAYDALRNLVENYDCIEGYPNRTFRGDRPLTRYEFAAGLNACLDAIGVTQPEISREEFDQLKRLVNEFEAELATLGTRVDNLEGRVSFLEDHQFSTTTKLKGEAIFTIGGQFGDAVGSNDNIIMADRVRLALDTSFSGKDQLYTRLQAGNFGRFNTATQMARLGHDENTGNSVEIDRLWYNFPVGDKAKLWIAPVANAENLVSDVYNPYMESSGTGALSRFLRRNPAVYRFDVENQALAANINLSDNFGIDLGYFTGAGENPGLDRGLFNGSYAGLVQLNWEPSDNVGLGFAYVHSYHDKASDGTYDIDLTGNTGTGSGNGCAKRAIESGNGDCPFGAVPTSADRFGLQGTWEINDKLNLAGWGGYVTADSETTNATAEIWNWAANLSILDLGKDGAVLNIGGGMLPRVGRTGGTAAVASDTGTSYIVEANYKYPVNKNIIITPGVYVILDPGHNAANDAIWVGAVRTTFKF
jgi:hypothetical protein